MTVYYIDPWIGSNSNSGASWAAAWKTAVGNGTSILAGDELRYAKSPTATTTVAFPNTQGTIVMPSPLYYGYTVPSSWSITSIANLSVAGAGVYASAAVTVPAATKIIWAALSMTDTTHRRISVAISMLGLPTGTLSQYLQVHLCSDTAGATIVHTLTGYTESVPTAATSATCTFVYESASDIALSIGSIAVYSVASFPIAIYGSFTVSEITLSPNSSSVDFLGPGSGVVFNTLGAYDGGITTPSPSIEAGRKLYRSGGTGISLETHATTFLWNTNTASKVHTYYKAAPYDSPADFPTSLTFAGAAGNTIKVRGGWDTATGVQDGYTLFTDPLRVKLASPAVATAVLSFSAGGTYIEYERILASGLPIARYTYPTASSFSLGPIALTDCTANYIVALPNVNNTLSVSAVTATRCSLGSISLAVRDNLYGVAIDYTYGGASVGPSVFTDCCSYLAAAGVESALPTTRYYSGIEFIGSTAFSSIVYGISGASLIVAGADDTDVRFTNTKIVGRVGIQSYIASSAATLAKVTANTIKLVTAASTGSAGNLIVRNIRTFSLHTFTMHGAVGSGVYILHDGSSTGVSAAWRLNNSMAWTIGGDVSIPVDSAASLRASYTGGVTVDTSYSDTSSAYLPLVVLTGVRQGLVQNCTLSHVNIEIGTSYGTLQPVEYTNIGIELRNVTTKLFTYGPSTYVKAYGCTFGASVAKASAYYCSSGGSISTTSPTSYSVSLGNIRAYGCTVVGTQGTGCTPNLYKPSGYGVWAGTKGTVTLGTSAATTWNRSARACIKGDPTLTYSNTSAAFGSLGFAHRGFAIASSLSSYAYANGQAYAVSDGSLSYYGKRTLVFKNAVPIAKVYVVAGTNVALSAVVLPSAVATVALIARPSSTLPGANVTALVQHKYGVTSGVETSVSLNIAPSVTGVVDIIMYANVSTSLVNFTVTHS